MNAAKSNKMKTMKWLIKREFWENKGLYFWAQVALAAIITVIVPILTYNLVFSSTPMLQPMSTDLLQINAKEVVDLFRNLIIAPMAMLSFVSAFYLMSSLHTERQDRSIQFWKSLPISDAETALSKLALPLIIGPLIAFFLTLLSHLLIAIVVACLFALKGHNIFGLIFSNPDFYLQPLKIFTLLPIYALWALPTVGWLLMISAVARSRVFPWAYGVPLLVLLVLMTVNIGYKLHWNMFWLVQNVFARLLVGTVPGTWAIVDPRIDQQHNMFNPESVYEMAWERVASPEMWLGVVAGIVMIAAAVRLRRYGAASN